MRAEAYLCNKAISYCKWSVTVNQSEVAKDDSSEAAIVEAATALSGQILQSVEIDPNDVSSTFTFDLGGELKTWPDDVTEEQWFLYDKQGGVFILRGDGFCFSGSSESEPDDSDWVRIS